MAAGEPGFDPFAGRTSRCHQLCSLHVTSTPPIVDLDGLVVDPSKSPKFTKKKVDCDDGFGRRLGL